MVKMRVGNKGLTVKVNFWAMDEYKDQLTSNDARLWMRGVITHADTAEEKHFHDAGELLTILSKWNVAKFKELKKNR